MRTIWQNISANGFWDKTGTAVSWICAIHCLAMPFLVSYVTFLGLGILADEIFEYVFIGLSVLIASISLLPGFFRFHRSINALLLFSGGIGLIIFADGIFEENPSGKMIFVVLGACFITTAHFLNRYLCKKCAACKKTGDCSLK